MYIRKDGKVILERFDGGDNLRAKLQQHGFTFCEEDFLSGFWGKRFIIDRPIGRGSGKRLALLGEL